VNDDDAMDLIVQSRSLAPARRRHLAATLSVPTVRGLEQFSKRRAEGVLNGLDSSELVDAVLALELTGLMRRDPNAVGYARLSLGLPFHAAIWSDGSPMALWLSVRSSLTPAARKVVAAYVRRLQLYPAETLQFWRVVVLPDGRREYRHEPLGKHGSPEGRLVP
jgi:hypothetical protein